MSGFVAPIPVRTDYRGFRIMCAGRSSFDIFEANGVVWAFGVPSLELAKDLVDLCLESA